MELKGSQTEQNLRTALQEKVRQESGILYSLQ